MQPKHRFLSIGAACLVSILSLQCHKSNSAPPQVCKLTSVTATGGGLTTNYDITSDSIGRPVTIKVSGNSGPSYVTSFTYSPNRIISSHLYAGYTTPTTIDTVFFINGRIATISVKGSNGDYGVTTYSYDGQGQLTQSTIVYNGIMTTQSSYQMSGGDIISGNDGGTAFSYTYYTNKAATILDYLAMQEWLNYGAVIRKSRHLVQSFQTDHISQTFNYTFDDKGKITDAIATENTTHATGSYHYTYDCN